MIMYILKIKKGTAENWYLNCTKGVPKGTYRRSSAARLSSKDVDTVVMHLLMLLPEGSTIEMVLV